MARKERQNFSHRLMRTIGCLLALVLVFPLANAAQSLTNSPQDSSGSGLPRPPAQISNGLARRLREYIRHEATRDASNLPLNSESRQQWQPDTPAVATTHGTGSRTGTSSSHTGSSSGSSSWRRSLKQMMDLFGTSSVGSSALTGLGGLGGLGSMGGMSSLAGFSGMGSFAGLGGMSSLAGLGGLSSLAGMNGLGDMSSLGGLSGMSGMSGLGGLSGLSSLGGTGLGGASLAGLFGGSSSGSGMDLARQVRYNNAASTLTSGVAPILADQHNAAQSVHGTLRPIMQNAAQVMGPLVQDAATYGHQDLTAGVMQTVGNAATTMRPFIAAGTNHAANAVQQTALAANNVASSTLVPMAMAAQPVAQNVGNYLSSGFNDGFNEGFTASMERREPYASATASRNFYANQPAVFLPPSFQPLGAMANITYPCPIGPGNTIAPVGTIIGPGIPCGVVLQMVPKAAVPRNAMAPTVVNPTPVQQLLPFVPSPSPSPVPSPIPVSPIGPPPAGGGGTPPLVPPIVNPSPAPGGGPITPPIVRPSPSPNVSGLTSYSSLPGQDDMIAVSGPYDSTLEAALSGRGQRVAQTGNTGSREGNGGAENIDSTSSRAGGMRTFFGSLFGRARGGTRASPAGRRLMALSAA